MGRRKSWFTFVRRLFVSESKTKPDEKPKKWRWLFRKFRLRRYPVLEGPQDDELRKRALAVAIATAAAAEVAVAAANAAAEVVRLTNIPYENERRRSWGHAAVVIQCAYRRHLATKALSALRGVVKLQAVVRGQLVRRRVVEASLIKCFLSNARRMVPDYLTRSSCGDGNNHDEVRTHCGTRRSWDLSSISKEEMEAFYRQKQEAITKRDRMKRYSSSQRERRSDQSQELIRETRRIRQHDDKEKLPLPRTEWQSEWIDDDFRTPFSQPRRSLCHAKHKSFGDDRSLPSSPVFPTYMAATTSAKAKLRSLSTPRQRLRLRDTYSPFKLKLDSWSSLNGELIKSGRNNVSQYVFSTFGTLN